MRSLPQRPIIPHRLKVARRQQGVPLICAASILASLTAPVLNAQTIIKANTSDNLDQSISWVGGAVPGPANIALWDNTVTGTNTTFLGSNLSWRGIRITNPSGLVTIEAGSTLTLGSGGIDMAAASADLILNNAVTLLGATAQTWSLAAGRNLSINGTLTRSAGASLDLNIGTGGTIKITSLAASTLLNYASLNQTDFAAIDASNNVVPGATVLSYTPNPSTGAANPDFSGTVAVMDFVNSNTGATNGVRISSSTGLTVTGGLRFNAPHDTAAAWTIDTAGRNLNIGNRTILVTPNVGTDDVQINGSGNVRLAAGNDLLLQQYNTAGNLIFNAQINQPTGAGASVTKVGAGKVIFASNGNGYLGGTRILEGTLQIGNGGTSGVLGSGDVTNNGTLAFNRSDNITVIHNILGSGGVTQMGPGELTFTTNVSTYAGPTNLNGGTLAFTTPQNLGNSSAINFNGGALKWVAGNTADISARAVTLNSPGGTIDTNGNNVTFANSIGNAGLGGVTKTGTGTLTLAGANNNYAGPTSVNAGTLNVTGSLTGSGAVSIASGATLGGTGSIAGTTSISSGGILSPGVTVGTLTLGGLTLSDGTILNFDFSGASGNDSVVVTSPGGLTINGGSFNLYNVGTSASWSTPGTYNLFSLNGGIQGVGLGALSVLNPAAGFNYTFGSNSNFLTLTVTAAGVISDWTLDANGSWATAANWTNGAPNQVDATARFGGITTQSRTITLDGNKTVGAISFENTNSYTIAQGTGGSLIVQRTSGAAQNVVVKGTHTISAPVVLVSDLSADIAAGGTLTVSGAVSGPKAIMKTGAGELVLSGANSYTAGTQINDGTVEFASLGSLGTGSIGFGGGTLRWASGNTADISSRTVTFGTGGAALNTNGNDVTLTEPIGNAGAGGLTKAGNGTLTLQGANTYTGPTRITGGTLSISSNGNLGDESVGAGITLDGGTLAVTSPLLLDFFGLGPRAVAIGAAGGGLNVAEFATLTIPGNVSGSGPLVKSGPGTLTLSGANGSTLNSPVTVSGGTVVLATPDNSQQALGTGAVTLSGGTLTLAGSTGNNGTQYGTFSNALVIPAGQTGTVNMTQRGGLTSTLTGAGTFNLNVNYVRGDVSANWSGFTGQINVNNTAGGPDDFRLAGFVALNIPQARLNLGDGVIMYQTFNPPSGTGTQTVHNIGELSGAATAVVGGNPAGGRFSNWTVGALNTDSTFAGAIQDTAGAGASRLTKVGTGTLTLSGFNTYTGQTDVNGGTLLVSGNLSGTSAVNVGAGSILKLGASDALSDLATFTLNSGTLEASGFSDVLGTLALGVDGTIDFGSGASVLHFADSSAQFWIGTRSITNWSGAPGGGGADQLFFGSAASALTIDQLSLIQFLNPAGFSPGSYGARILENGEIVAVPEPSAVMFLLGGAALLARRRRQRA